MDGNVTNRMPHAQEASSWAETLQQYQQQRQRLPWAADHPDYCAPKYVTHATVKQKDRERDPVTMRFRSEAREQQASEHERMVQERRQQQSMRRSREWDLITNSSKGAQATQDPRMMHRTQSNSPRAGSCNIISNLPKDFRTSLHYDEQKVQEYHTTQLQAEPAESALQRRQAREFNILSNKRVDLDGEKSERRREEQLRREIEAKYWEEHDWDPISGTFYDQSKETAFQDKLHARLHALRDNRHDVSKRPTYFSKAEGVGYDIISKEVRNPDVYGSVCAKQERRLRRPAPFPQRQSEVLQQDVDTGVDTFGKTSFQRFTKDDHGYDLITLNDKDFNPPRVPKPAPRWTKLKPHPGELSPSAVPMPTRNLAVSTVNSPISIPTQQRPQEQPQLASETQSTHRTQSSARVPTLNLTGLASSQQLGSHKSVRTKGFQ